MLLAAGGVGWMGTLGFACSPPTYGNALIFGWFVFFGRSGFSRDGVWHAIKIAQGSESVSRDFSDEQDTECALGLGGCTMGQQYRL